jgi:hypothetical protein
VKAWKIVVTLAAVVLIALAIRLPIATTPGFLIGGTASSVPATWPDTSSTHEIRLRVKGTIPRVVIIWFVSINNELYIVGETDSGWVSMLENGDIVQMRLQDSTYSLQANIVTSGEEEILQAWLVKYEADYPEFVNTSASEEFLEYSSIYRLSRID